MSKINLENIYAYIQGKLRYKLYYSKRLNWLIPLHIFEQISYRILVMDKECYSQGSCKLCGCETPALQMANKSCKKPCYPEIMNKEEWAKYKRAYSISIVYTKGREFKIEIKKTYRG